MTSVAVRDKDALGVLLDDALDAASDRIEQTSERFRNNPTAGIDGLRIHARSGRLCRIAYQLPENAFMAGVEFLDGTILEVSLDDLEAIL